MKVEDRIKVIRVKYIIPNTQTPSPQTIEEGRLFF